jgi:hypothetical protein
MRLRVITAVLVAVAMATVLGAAAFAGSAARHARSKTSLEVRSCQTSDDADKRKATFYASMRALPRTRRMMMRFTLVDRSSDEPSTVKLESLKRWRRSGRGVRKFGYAQTVTGLEAGHTYGAKVRFRWIGRHGRRLASAGRASGDCRQDGGLPNLALKRVTARRGLDPSAEEVYSLAVVNRGNAEARSVKVNLIVDSREADSAEIESVAPGDHATVEISGPRCEARIRAVVDPDDAITETTEDDNTRRQRCPAVAR